MTYIFINNTFTNTLNPDYIKFIDTWQTLIGSAIGASITVLGSLIVTLIINKISSAQKEKKELKESLRRIEISITRSLDSTFKMRQQLQKIVKRINNLALKAEKEADQKTFFLDRINFPPVREVYRDKELTYFKIKSYYLHNIILWIDEGIKEVNEINANFKNDFDDLVRQNELIATLILKNQNPDPSVQVISYTSNLKNFSAGMEEYINQHIPSGIKIMTRIKVYNEHLRRKHHGNRFLWKNEGTKYKFFKNKDEQKKFSRSLDSIERIDKIIELEVIGLIKKAEDREAELSQKLH